MANLQETIEEIWKDIPEYEGLYKISSYGFVKSIGRKGSGSASYDTIRKNSQLPTGYLFISLFKNTIGKQFYVHRLVAICFLPKPIGKDFINHIDGKKSNNKVANLEWCTSSENMIHARKMGLFKQVFGTKCANVVLTEIEARTIKELSKTKTTEEIRSILKIPKERRHLIANIKCGRIWKHL